MKGHTIGGHPNFVVMLAIAAIVTAALAAAPVAAAPTATTATILTAINQARSDRGVPPVTVDPGMAPAVQAWTDHMAATRLHHSPSYAERTAVAPVGWRWIGEILGRGPSVEWLMAAILGSPTHASILLDPRHDRVAIGVAVAPNGRIIFAARFVDAP